MAKKVYIALGLVVVLLVAGCGGGSQSSSTPSQEPEIYNEAEEEATYPEEEAGGSLTNVGSIVSFPEEGQSFTTEYSIGPLQYPSDGLPPEEVVNACMPEVTGPLQRSVYARGELTITYSEGSLPFEYTISTDSRRGVITQEHGLAMMAMEVGGEWFCRSPAAFYVEFEPGETRTIPFWLIVEEVLTNSQPKVPPSVFENWYFEPIFFSRSTEEVIRGPGVGMCPPEGWETEEAKVLLLYNTSGNCR